MTAARCQSPTEHLALVTEGPRTVQANFLRTLALGLLGREGDARQCLNSITSGALSRVDAYSARWLARFLEGQQRQPGATDGGSQGPTTTP
jgi:hypothetical protein